MITRALKFKKSMAARFLPTVVLTPFVVALNHAAGSWGVHRNIDGFLEILMKDKDSNLYK